MSTSVRVEAGVVVCDACDAEMRAQVGHASPDGGDWLWWLCRNGHASAAIPRPPVR